MAPKRFQVGEKTLKFDCDKFELLLSHVWTRTELKMARAYALCPRLMAPVIK